jgi:transposase
MQRHVEAQRLGGLEIDDQLVLCRLLDVLTGMIVAEKALIAVIQEAYVQGISTRSVDDKSLVASLRAWLEQQLVRVSAKAPIAEEIRYGLNHWDGLIRFLEDGRLELDTNNVERGIRPIVLSRKNALFAGHDHGAENWACIASLIETCKLTGVDPQAYLTDVLTKLVNLWPASSIDELMPWAWAAEHSAKRLAA